MPEPHADLSQADTRPRAKTDPRIPTPPGPTIPHDVFMKAAQIEMRRWKTTLDLLAEH